MDSINLNFLPHTKLLSQILKAHQNPHKISVIWYIVGLCRFHFRRVIWIRMRKYFLCSKSMNRLLFYMAIFLRFVSHLLQFSTHEKLLYTKILEILWGFCRTLLFFGSCSRTRVISPKASPLFFRPPLNILHACILSCKISGLNFGGIILWYLKAI